MSNTAKVLFSILFVLVIVSLALNGYLIWQLMTVQQQVRSTIRQAVPELRDSLDQTINDLAEFEQSTIELTVDIDEEFPINTEVTIDEVFEVPLDVTIPISQTINTTFALDLLGNEVPFDISVPVDVEVPIQNTFEIPINRTVPVATTVDLETEVPIAVDVSETNIAEYVGRLRGGLESLKGALDDVSTAVR